MSKSIIEILEGVQGKLGYIITLAETGMNADELTQAEEAEHELSDAITLLKRMSTNLVGMP